jgi:hypothetical protein
VCQKLFGKDAVTAETHGGEMTKPSAEVKGSRAGHDRNCVPSRLRILENVAVVVVVVVVVENTSGTWQIEEEGNPPISVEARCDCEVLRNAACALCL